MNFIWKVETVRSAPELQEVLNQMERDMFRIFYISPVLVPLAGGDKVDGFMVVGKLER